MIEYCKSYEKEGYVIQPEGIREDFQEVTPELRYTNEQEMRD